MTKRKKNRKAYITLFLFTKKKTCAKRKNNRKFYIRGRRKVLHSSISDGSAEERYINTENNK